MNKLIKICLISALSSYVVKLVVDLVMYVFTVNGSGAQYDDFYYLALPQFAASVLMVCFYVLFFRDEFFSWFFRIFTIVMVLVNIALGVLIYFDSKVNYIWYFAMIAADNFANALFLKCNIIPESKDGNIEHYPMLFEGLQFICMVMSLYAFFCGFPYFNEEICTYYDLMMSFKINMVCEIILIFTYILCMRNDSEIIRDNMFDYEIID